MMRFVSISSNKNTDYHYFLPIIQQVWRSLNWSPIITEVEGVLESQMARMTPPPHVPDHALYMVSDADMLPLPDFNQYIEQGQGRVSIMGWDITGFSQVPMCYVLMPALEWRRLMDFDWKAMYDQYEDGMNKWTFDQHLLTTRLKELHLLMSANLINRNQYPYLGRRDRSRWEILPDNKIDCHMLRPGNGDNYLRTKENLLYYYPNQDWTWLDKYTENYATTSK